MSYQISVDNLTETYLNLNFEEILNKVYKIT